MGKRFVIVGAVAIVLVVLAVVYTPVRGQMARGVTVICGNCEVQLPSRDGRAPTPATGAVLRNDATGDLWFYTFSKRNPPVMLGTLTEVGKPIAWATPE